MKKVFWKISIYSIIIGVLLQLVELTVPFYWGDTVLNAKMEFLEDKRAEYNVFFMGSSRIYRQIIPQIFDKNCKTKSFNLGSPATGNPELHYLTDNFVNHRAEKPTYLFLDYVSIVRITDINWGTTKAKYHLNFFGLKLFFQDLLDKPFTQKYDYYLNNIKNYLRSFAEKSLKIGYRKDLIKFFTKEDYNYLSLVNNQQGYLSFEYELANSTKHRKKTLMARHNRFLKGKKRNLVNINERAKVYSRDLQIANLGTLYHTHLKEIQQLIEKAKHNNYHIIITCIPPGTPFLKAIVNNLPEDHKLDLFDPEKYQDLFKEEVHFDDGHLNEEGAYKLTEYLAEEFNSLREKKNNGIR